MLSDVLTSVRMDEKLLLLNHLEFLRTHRGELHSYHGAWCINSDRKEFTFTIPDETSSIPALVCRYGTFYLKPEAMQFELELTAMGFSQSGALNYMTREVGERDWKINDLIEVRRAEDERDILTFSKIQARGFCDSESEFDEWHPWLRDANLQNRANPSQAFYIAYSANEPVGVALAVFRNPVVGIYAVTTLPHHRKQGVSATILNQIANDASSKGIEFLSLQADHGSYAEFFYQRHGFKSNFLMKIMSREKL